MPGYHTRAEVPLQYTWDLSCLFADSQDWEREFQALEQSLPEFAALRATLAGSAEALLSILQKKDAFAQRLERLYIYALLRKDEDTTSDTSQRMAERAMSLSVRASMATSYIEPELLALPEHTFDRFLQTTPALSTYRHLLDDARRKRPHVRSAEVEDLLKATSEISQAPERLYTTLSNADLRFPALADTHGAQLPLTPNTYLAYMRSPDRQLRKAAFAAFHQTFLAHRHTFAAFLSTQIKAHVFHAQQRHYQTCRAYALARDHIPVSVYDTVVQTVSESIPLFNRYLKVRKQLLQVDELHLYDFSAPLGEAISAAISYQQACETIIQALAPLGERYIDVVRQALRQRWIDVYETPGKRGGAYSSGAYGAHPFLLMNWQNTYKSMYTLAHELGHCVHAYFTRSHQPYHYSNATIFVSEVAAILNERLLTSYLLAHTTDPATRLAMLSQSLEELRSKLFRQALSAEFEHLIHCRGEAREALTADVLESLYQQLNEKYYGAQACVDELIRIEWASIPHFYYNFYVYQYATGISAASALVQHILQEGQPAVERYLRFLSAGSCTYSIELLQQAGVDMTTPLPVQQTLQLFASHLSQLQDISAQSRAG
ncbi:MAG TPA: oligoendopeptidase F [Ktedonobacteraceae bacterium]|jgi:oligoendopeptidase F